MSVYLNNADGAEFIVVYEVLTFRLLFIYKVHIDNTNEVVLVLFYMYNNNTKTIILT